MHLLPGSLTKRLTLAGAIAAIAWMSGLHLAFLPLQLPGFPRFVTAGLLEWVATIVGLAAGAWSFRLLHLAFQSRGAPWWACVIGLMTATAALLVAVLLLIGLLLSRR